MPYPTGIPRREKDRLGHPFWQVRTTRQVHLPTHLGATAANRDPNRSRSAFSITQDARMEGSAYPVLPVLCSELAWGMPFDFAQLPEKKKRYLPKASWHHICDAAIGWLPELTHFQEECAGESPLVLKVNRDVKRGWSLRGQHVRGGRTVIAQVLPLPRAAALSSQGMPLAIALAASPLLG